MSNKLPSKKPSYTVNDNNFISPNCHHCGKTGEILIRQRIEQRTVQIVERYYLCKPCFLKLLTPHCPECEENNREYTLFRDIQRLEISCLTCGTVLTSLITEEHEEKRDYTTNRPVDYNDSLEAVLDNHNWNKFI